MIHKITRIKKFGLLNNFNTTLSIKPFNNYNLIYGWNGSGKTTLSRLFRCLETKTKHSEYSDADFSIELIDGSNVDSKSLENNIEIKVFNQDFVADNLNLFEAQTKPIIFISKEKVDEKKKLDSKKIELKEKQIEKDKLAKEIERLYKTIDDFHKNSGKAIKDFLLGTIYANVTYNKKTSSDIWKNILSNQESLEKHVLSEEELIKQKNLTLLNSRKDEIYFTSLPETFNISKLSIIEKNINELLNYNITSNSIQRLKEHSDISDWVSAGLTIHKRHNSNNCEFCGEPLKKVKLDALEGHFSKEYNWLIARLISQIDELQKTIISEINNERHLLYENLKDKYDKAVSDINEIIRVLNPSLIDWINLLSNKKNKPFSSYGKSILNNSYFLKFNDALVNLKKIIDEHNEISKKYQFLAEKAKIKIESHFVCKFAVEEKIREIEEKIEITTIKKEGIETIELSIKSSISSIEDELRSDTLAIGEINENLHRFLGRSDILLERQNEGGYLLKRGTVIARNLSEGEKTAISLIYFFSKIQENDSIISNQIIILDDPISSFDSNHLFNASSLINKYTKGVKQLFVLTHNFWFFKQVRDWMLKKNKKNQPEVSNIYLIKQGELIDATASLIKFHSEYQHVFNTVLNYQDMEEFDDSICFTIANSIRRLLEAFTSFKTPDNSGFNGALELGIKKGLDTQQKDRIYYFINKYSHLDRIESFDNTVEPLLEEGKNVVNDVLWLIKKVDEDHYSSMLKICGIEDKLKA